MLDNYETKSGNTIRFERPCGLNGVTELTILQNWRDILTIEEVRTSGTRASDVWSEPEIYTLTVKQLNEMVEEELIAPYGDIVTIIGS